MADYSAVFNRKGKLNKKGKALIQIYVYFGDRKKLYVSTGLYLDPKHWDEKKNKVSDGFEFASQYNYTINEKIRELETYEMQRKAMGKEFGIDILRDHLQGKSTEAMTFNKFCRSSLKSDKSLRPSTIEGYEDTLDKLDDFNRNIRFSELDYKLIKQFDNYIRGLGLSHNSVWKNHKNLKRFINEALKQKLITEYPYDNFSVTYKKPLKEVLTDKQVYTLIEKLPELPEKYKGSVERFLFSVGTGLRFSDVVSIRKEHLVDTDNGLSVALDVMKKTDFPVKVPLYEYFDGIAEKIIREYLPLERKTILRPEGRATTESLNSIDNANIKTVQAMLEFNKVFSFHAARHTFLTEVAHRTGSVFQVMKYGGIRKIDTAMIYVHLAEDKF